MRGPRRCAGPVRRPVGVSSGEPGRVGLEVHPLPDHLGAHVDVAGGVHVDGQAEPVQQLRPQLALFRVHGADQHEARLVAVRNAVAFDVHPAHRGGVEQHVDQVVVQQVDLVDVQHAAVRAGQQARRERMLAVAQHALQIQRADHPVLGGADRQLDEADARPTAASTCGQPAHGSRLRGALLAADQHAADLRPDRAQHQRQPQLVVPDDRAERIVGRHAARILRCLGCPAGPQHRHVRNAVVDELLAVADEAVLGVHLVQVGLGVDAARVVAHLGQRGLQQPGGVTVAAGGALGAHPADPERLLAAGVLLHQPQGADDLAVLPFQPEVPGLGEQVAAVEFRVRAGLLDDEHLDAQLQQLVEGGGVQILGPGPAQATVTRPPRSGPRK